MNKDVNLIIKNKKRLFFISTTILFFSAASFRTEAGKYEFTIDIYNQENVHQEIKQANNEGRFFSEEEINKIMESELHRKKLQQIKGNCINTIQEKLNFLENEFSIALGEERKRGFIGRLGGLFDYTPMVGVMLASTTTNPAAPLIGAGLQASGRLITTSIFSDDAPHAPPSAIVGEIRKLELEVIDLVKGLATEPGGDLSELEKAYVRKKRRIMDPVLKGQIEKDFLSARQNFQFGMSAAEFIANALKLPLSHKRIDESEESIEERFDKNPSFSSYDSETRKILKNILLQIKNDSLASDDSEVSLRHTLCFHGIASSGKTTAAKQLAEFFDLPYIEKSISDFKELNEANLEGSRASFNVNVGWFITPFLKLSKEENRSYRNPFLIINDSDGILSPNNPAAKAFYGNYLDPDKKTFNNKYFKIDFPINRLTVIITTNTHVETAPENLPLTTRLKFIHFPKLTEEAIKPTMDKKLESLREWGKFPEFMTLLYVSPTQIQVDYKNEQLEQYGISTPILPQPIDICLPQDTTPENITPRDLEHKYLKATLIDFIKKGRNRYNEGLKKFGEGEIGSGETFFVLAARKGHPKALMFLKEFQRAPLTNSENLGQYALRVGEYYTEMEDTGQAKSWYKISGELGNPKAKEKLRALEQDEERIRSSNFSPTVSALVNFPNFPEYRNDDKKVKKEISRLHKLKDKIVLLRCETEEKQALKELIGSPPSFWSYLGLWERGLINDLWETHSWRDGGWWNGAPGNIQALNIRMRRVPEVRQKMQVLKFHLQLVMGLTDTLLLQYRGNNINKDKYNINTIKGLIEHIEQLSLEQDFLLKYKSLLHGNNDLLNEYDILLNEYKTWFNTKSNIGLNTYSKIDLLLQLII